MKHAPLLGLILALPLLGCVQAPPGEDDGRLSVSETTRHETGDPRILPVALVEFSDIASEELVQDLASMREVASAPGRVTVIVGDINNKTQVVSSDEFEMMRSRMRNNLLNSRYATDRLSFVENRARMNQLRQREMVLPTEGPVEPAPYDPNATFALNGDFYRVSRGRVNQYYMEFQLVSFASNEIVFSKRYDLKQKQSEP